MVGGAHLCITIRHKASDKVVDNIPAMADVKFYYDPLSQPCRTVMLLLAACEVKHEDCLVQILKGETKSNEDFVKVSATGAVPAIDDNGFHLFESVAIMKYLISKYNLPDHWYPSDLKQRAKVDEYLNWHSIGMRQRGAANYFVHKWLLPNVVGRSVSTEKIEEGYKTLQSALKMMEEHFLKETKFVNSDQISIADLLAVCELTQLWMSDEDVTSDRPRINQWIADVKSALSPHFDEVHKLVYLYKKEKTVLKKD